MKQFIIVNCVLAIFSTSCASNYDPSEIQVLDLSKSYENATFKRGQIVKACGWATNAFENVQITNTRDEGWRKFANGFGVDWLKAEPRTLQPEKRCVTGEIIPTCGWEILDQPDEICLSTGHGFKYEIHQTRLTRK